MIIPYLPDPLMLTDTNRFFNRNQYQYLTVTYQYLVNACTYPHKKTSQDLTEN